MGTENVGMKEREISLWNLMVELLLHWRALLIGMLVGAILFAGISYIKSVQNMNAQKEQAEQKEETEEWRDANKLWLEEQLTETQLNNVNNVLLYEKLAEEKERYQSQSVLMQIDPFHIQHAELTFFIESEDIEKTYNIEKVYEDLLTSNDLFEYIQQQCGIEHGVNELVWLERSSYGQMQGSDTVRIRISHSDADVCRAMSEAMVEYVKMKKDELEKTLGYHDVTLLSATTGESMDAATLDRQRNLATDITNLRNIYIKWKEAFTDEEWHYYNFLTEGKAAENPDTDKIEQEGEDTKPVAVMSPNVSIKYVVLGAFLFAFVYVFLIFLQCILNNKLRATDNFQELYDVSQLGCVSVKADKKRFLGVIDQWILKLRYRNQRRFAAEEAIGLATVAVKIAAKKQGLSQVCLMGCNLSDRTKQICDQIKTSLAEEQITVETLNNVLYDAETMEKLENAQGTVLVETVGSTMYEEIVQELQLLNRQGIKVLGGIVVE